MQPPHWMEYSRPCKSSVTLSVFPHISFLNIKLNIFVYLLPFNVTFFVDCLLSLSIFFCRCTFYLLSCKSSFRQYYRDCTYIFMICTHTCILHIHMHLYTHMYIIRTGLYTHSHVYYIHMHIHACVYYIYMHICAHV